MRHWIKVSDPQARGGYYLTHVFFKDEKQFRKDYEKLPRRREYQKRLAGVRVRVWQKKKIIVKERWRITTLKYAKKPEMSYSAWIIDLMKVERESESTFEGQLKYCFKYLSKAFSKVLKEGGEVKSSNWPVDFAKYKEYLYTQDIIESMGLEWIQTFQDEGREEENMDLWRYQK